MQATLVRSPRGGRTRSPLRLALVVAAGAGTAAVGCAEPRQPPPRRLEVLRVSPWGVGDAADSVAELFLNQEVTVRFSLPLDRLSISEDTVRISDGRGHRVKGSLRTSSHAVTFVPVAPLTPTLDDGSFAPGLAYRLDVVGFPRANAVRAADGQVLERSIVRLFRAVDADRKPSPLLRLEISPLGFALDGGSLGMAAGSRILRLYFHEPPVPTSVTPRAFKVYRSNPSGRGGFEELGPRAVRLRALAGVFGHLPAWTVELEFERAPMPEPGYLCVELVADDADMLRDAIGRPPRLLAAKEDSQLELSDVVGLPLVVTVHSGERVPLVRVNFALGAAFQDVSPGAVKFEVRDGRAVPLVRGAAGSGALGVFAPRGHMELLPGRPFDRGDGVLVRAENGVFDFAGVFIPRGTVVRVVAGADPVEIRACGSIRIEGDLVLVGTRLGQWSAEASDVALPALVDGSGSVLLAAGDILMLGQIRHEAVVGARPAGSPLTLVCGGGMVLGGRLPLRTVLATEPGGHVAGAAQGSPIRVTVASLSKPLPPGPPLAAAAVTEWLRLPARRMDAVEVELGGADGVEVEVQVAVGDPSNPARALDDQAMLHAPVRVPLVAPLSLPPAGFVRFFLRGTVKAGEKLPSLASISLVDA